MTDEEEGHDLLKLVQSTLTMLEAGRGELVNALVQTHMALLVRSRGTTAWANG